MNNETEVLSNLKLHFAINNKKIKMVLLFYKILVNNEGCIIEDASTNPICMEPTYHTAFICFTSDTWTYQALFARLAKEISSSYII